MSQFDDFTNMIQMIIRDETKYFVPRLGIVSQIIDPISKGRILVKIPSLGWDADDKAAWCFPKHIKGIVTPNVGDYVLIEFVDGNMTMPVYSGIAHYMKDMIPKNYTSEQTQVIAESRDGVTAIKITEILNELILKTGDASGWAPNVLTIDPFSGALHGGIPAGIVKLKGE